MFLLVNYFNEDEVAEFVRGQLKGALGDTVNVVIIDNGSKNKRVLGELSSPYVTVIDAKENLGYFGAACLGLESYLNQYHIYPDATIVCNTDISFISPDFISFLKEIIKTKEFDILGPDIYSTFLKYHQNPYIVNRIAEKRLRLYKFVTSNWLFYSLFTLLHLMKTKFVKANPKNHISSSTQPYAIHGSFMVFAKSYFEKGGTIKYPSFLFGEELFVAETALKLNLKTVYEPTLVVHHNEHATTGVFKSRKTVKLLNQSYTVLLDLFFNKKK